MRECNCRANVKPLCSCPTQPEQSEGAASGARHKWHDVIVAFAEGKPIQFRNITQIGDWADTDVLSGLHYPWLEFRIKPTPRPDIVLFGAFVRLSPHRYAVKEIGELQRTKSKNSDFPNDNLKFIVDSETHQLKSVEIVK